ncbi:hypothetical protein B6U84_05715 [Candidatus Bathyarchaeota archaeon ex4484_40]|nr:MAG: hypothetical protein B6U84_05715 [Candidatus Bathyarchaeota archaeon ex4484_40]
MSFFSTRPREISFSKWWAATLGLENPRARWTSRTPTAERGDLNMNQKGVDIVLIDALDSILILRERT